MTIPTHIYYEDIPVAIRDKLPDDAKHVRINGMVLRIEYGSGTKVSAIDRNRRMNGTLI